MQRYNCSLCREDAHGGRSIIHGGMFFKICIDCAEDEDLYNELERKMMEATIMEEPSVVCDLVFQGKTDEEIMAYVKERQSTRVLNDENSKNVT